MVALVIPSVDLHRSWMAGAEEFHGAHIYGGGVKLRTLGHIGYSVRPSARRRGFAGDALRDALPIALSLGIQRVLITCDEGNVGSRRTTEKNGGVYEDSRKGKRRYWIDSTSPTKSGN